MKTRSYYRSAVGAALLSCSLFFTQCQGPQGEPGPTGNANVKQFNFGPFKFLPVGDFRFYYTYNLPGTTTEEIQKSLVMVYVKYSSADNGSLWYLLPSAIRPDFRLNVRVVDSTPGKINLMLDNYANPPASAYNFPVEGMRVLVVPADTFVSARISGDFFENYERVSAHFNLPD